jgi:hypothetical protein
MTHTTSSAIRQARRSPLKTLLGTITALAIAATLHATFATAAQAATPTKPWLKPVLGGLLDRQHEPSTGFAGTVDGYVAEVAWADLQPTPGAALAPNNPIDQEIAQARVRGLKIKLRVLAGTSAPDWAKRLDGAPIPVIDEYGNTGTIGRFWTTRFARAYQDLQTKLAARYDATPEIFMTQITRCTTFFAEPFLRQGRTAQSVQSLLKAGYTTALDQACQHQQVDAHKVWIHTRSGLSLNPYQRINPDGSITNDEAFSEQMMTYFRAQLDQRAVLENHSIRSTFDQGPSYDKLYQAIRSLGGPISFQTAAPQRIGDLDATLAWAVQQGAASVELPISYRTTASPTSMLYYNRQLNVIANGKGRVRI